MPYLAALLLLAGMAAAGDTTYSRTEAVPKSPSRPSSPGPYPPALPSYGEDYGLGGDAGGEEGYAGISLRSEGSGKGFMNRCMDIELHGSSPKAALGALVALPLWMGICGTIGGLWTSHAHLFAGSGRMGDWPEGRWRFGGGIGFGAASMPGIAGGLPLDAHVELTGALSGALQLRLRTEAFANLMSNSVDYRREVYVDGERIGSQHDEMTGYIQAGFAQFVELVRPLGGKGLYLAGGAGGVRMSESIDYTRRNTFSAGEDKAKAGRVQVLPALDAAVGRYGGGGPRHFWRFEIRYRAVLHTPLRASSFPGDNADVTHALTWDWARF